MCSGVHTNLHRRDPQKRSFLDNRVSNDLIMQIRDSLAEGNIHSSEGEVSRLGVHRLFNAATKSHRPRGRAEFQFILKQALADGHQSGMQSGIIAISILLLTALFFDPFIVTRHPPCIYSFLCRSTLSSPAQTAGRSTRCPEKERRPPAFAVVKNRVQEKGFWYNP